MGAVIYLLDRIPFKDYNVFVSDSSALFDKPSFKEGLRNEWSDEHGFDIDLSKRYVQSKTITLDCFIPATSIQDCINTYNNFLNEIDKPKARRISVVADALRMEYDVFRNDVIETNLYFDEVKKVGVFKLKLVENMPIKRILKINQSATTISFASSKVMIISWGDGTFSYSNPSGTINIYTKNYPAGSLDYYPMILGDLDAISAYTSNCSTLWNKF